MMRFNDFNEDAVPALQTYLYPYIEVVSTAINYKSKRFDDVDTELELTPCN
jgi:hypothetical protein